ncbi:MAG TPA: flagellar protein FliT [Cerasibacillus sp.]|uniref:flagellar protein FliT n=1 Tax=Cerasibacillus sp. TaxID=2498711 RepID=UPI002F41C2B2
MHDVQLVYQLTMQMIRVLDNLNKTQRQDVIEQITYLIEKREQALQKLSPPYSKQEIEIGQKIILMNKTIEIEMNRLFLELKQDMKQMKQQRKSTQSYVNPYRAVQTVDGMFMDRKK